MSTRAQQLTQAEVAALIGLTYDSLRVKRTRDTEDFPEPDGHLGRTPWWLRGTIEDWLAQRDERAS